MSDRRSAWIPAWIDVALAAALLAVGLLEVWYDSRSAGAVGVTVLGTAVLAWRRTHPFWVVLVTGAAMTALTVQATDVFAVGQLLGLMLAAYSVAAVRSVPIATAGLGVLLAAALANSAAAPSTQPGDLVFPVILLGTPWVAGIALRTWRARAEQMRSLAADLASEREAHAKLVVVAERGRIARDLHDSLAQSLNAVVVHAEAAEAALGMNDAQVRSSLTRIRQVGRAALAETRLILGVLRADDDVPGQPVLDQLDELLDQYRATGLDVTLEHIGETRRLPSPVQAAIYRIVQESLSNVVRHSTGKRAWITIEHGDEVHVEVRDEGHGAGSASQESGFGILGMRERASSLGGELVAGHRDHAFVVRARIPYRDAS